MTDETPTDTNGTTPNPFEKPAEPSIVDTILDLDEFLSGDVRLAEKTAYFATAPQLEAEIDELEARLAEITDEQGRPVAQGESVAPGERSLADSQHPAYALADEIEAKRAEYHKSRRGVRVRQLSSNAWAVFKEKHEKALDAGAPFPQQLWDELIVACAIRPTFTMEKIQALRGKVGAPQAAEIELACWQVCTNSGVSVPKSPLSSLVQRQQARAKN